MDGPFRRYYMEHQNFNHVFQISRSEESVEGDLAITSQKFKYSKDEQVAATRVRGLQYLGRVGWFMYSSL